MSGHGPKALLKIDERYVILNLWALLLTLRMTRLAAEGMLMRRPLCVLTVYVTKSATWSHRASLLGMFCF